MENGKIQFDFQGFAVSVVLVAIIPPVFSAQLLEALPL